MNRRKRFSPLKVAVLLLGASTLTSVLTACEVSAGF